MLVLTKFRGLCPISFSNLQFFINFREDGVINGDSVGLTHDIKVSGIVRVPRVGSQRHTEHCPLILRRGFTFGHVP